MLGRPYDYAFQPHDDAIYCSELVYESYLDTCGRCVFKARPMNFRAPGESQPSAFWQEYYARLGKPVPQGVAGTHPADLAHDTILELVYSYY